MKHIYLLLTGVVLTLAPLIEEHVFRTKAAQLDWRLFIDSYSQPIGLFALFLATFRAWSEERGEREKAERATPEALKEEVRSLTARLDEMALKEWRALTKNEQDGLISDFRELGQHSIAIAASGAPDCMILAESFTETFKRAGWSVKRLSPRTYAAAGAWSINISGKDPDRLAHRIGEAIFNRVRWSAGSKLNQLQRDPYEILFSIGPKPPGDWHLK